ncbi:4131_t:CDS:2 [Funneliformis geosporum]|uniref:4131_t:CDS:1 n=1 Tax=Funneliformis geosporum TaxID=1117311 RepID=A0A9W4SXU6_9GLOM|nr:4131_t:CDS:2 [Funneliformis geosporum]
MINLLGKELKKEREQQLKYVVLTIIIGVGFYFLVYLPEQQRQQLEMTIQATIKQVSTAQPKDYSALLTTCQNYLNFEKTLNEMGGEENVTIFDKVVINPTRGEPDPVTEKDNNALFYGTGGTGKTSIVRKLAYESDIYPLIEIKGSNLTPRKEDNEIGIDPLNKFIFTLCDIENVLEDDYGFSKDVANNEVRYILFVDEADNISTHNAIIEYTKLIFLKSYPPVYRPGDFKQETGRLPEVKKESATKEKPTQPGIKIGEIKQLPHFYGKYEKPKKPTTEEIMPSITESIDVRLKELTEQLKQTKEEMSLQRNQYIGEFNQNISKLSITLGEIYAVGDITGALLAAPTFGASMVLSPTARGLVGNVLGGSGDDGNDTDNKLKQ